MWKQSFSKIVYYLGKIRADTVEMNIWKNFSTKAQLHQDKAYDQSHRYVEVTTWKHEE